MLLKLKILGHEIGNNTIKPIPSKIEAIKRIPSPKEKKRCYAIFRQCKLLFKIRSEIAYKSQSSLYFIT